MSKSRSESRSLVGRVKNALRRPRVWDIAAWIFKILYRVAKVFDLFL